MLPLMCIGWAALSATLLHQAADRTDAALIVPLAWIWGFTCLLAAFKLRRAALNPVLVIGLAIAVRAPLLGTPTLLSDDVYRYLFEGHVLNAGVNPFLYPPASLPGLLDEVRSLVNHPEVPTVYPPLALLWFRLLDATGAGVGGAQALAALADVFVVGALLRSGGRARLGALIYALHPLPALESASSAHLEAPALAFLAWASTSARLGPALAILGAGVKLFPALLLLPFLARSGWRWGLLGVSAALLTLFALAWPVLDAGPALFFALTNYTKHWSFNGLIWPWLAVLLGGGTARLLLLGVGAAVGLWSLWRGLRRPLLVWLILGTAFLALTPTAHPWYGLWALTPALFLGRWGWAVAGVAILGSYGVLSSYDAESGAWSEPVWLWFLTWPPALLGIGAELWWRRRQAISPPTPTKA